MAVIPLDCTKEIPKIKIVVGNAHPASIHSWLKAPSGDKHDFDGATDIDLTGILGITNTPDVDEKTFQWEVRVTKPTASDTQKCHVEVQFTQDGNAIHYDICEKDFKGDVALCEDSDLFSCDS